MAYFQEPDGADLMRDYSNTRGFIPFQDPALPGCTFYQTSHGWASIYATMMRLTFAGCSR